MKNLMDTNWVEVKVAMNPALLESCSPAFFNLGCQGINELDDEIVLYFDEADWNAQKPAAIETIVKQVSENNEISDMAVNHFPAENWNEKWKENFRTFHLGKKIVIRPEWEQYDAAEDEQALIINPKMAFGTGHHETTRLILEQLEDMDLAGKTILDAGTGSAILGIYTALKGAKNVMAFDHDPVAIDNALENAALNGVTAQMDIRCCGLSDVPINPYDLILANINRNVLLALSRDFTNYTHSGTVLILSGLLETDVKDIRPVYEKAGWHFVSGTGLGEWMCLVWQAPDTAPEK